MTDGRLAAFSGVGVEIEYAIVDRESLAVAPAADTLLQAAPGQFECEVEHGVLAWSNELALHVLEFKTNGPADGLPGLADLFQTGVAEATARLEHRGLALLPTGMHPIMDPTKDLRLWPHEYNRVYQTFDRIFGCRGHGWANLQSVHLNLPFANDGEFARLHGAVRTVLPLIPALAASSPIVESLLGPAMDSRLHFYRGNASRIPSVTGQVIPESVRSETEYREVVLERIYTDLAPHDPEGILRHEWVNARGAIARFDRGTIEIRVIDTQECPAADLAVAAAIQAVVRGLYDAESSDHLNALATERLAAVLDATIRDADRAIIHDGDYLRSLGHDELRRRTAGEVWRALIRRYLEASGDTEWSPALRVILDRGPLARRILRRVGADLAPERIRAVYDELRACLAAGASFAADD